MFANILEPTIVRTAAFKAEYDVKCDSLNNNSTKTFLQTVLVTRKLKLQKICGKGKHVMITGVHLYHFTSNYLYRTKPTLMLPQQC